MTELSHRLNERIILRICFHVCASFNGHIKANTRRNVQLQISRHVFAYDYSSQSRRHRFLRLFSISKSILSHLWLFFLVFCCYSLFPNCRRKQISAAVRKTWLWKTKNSLVECNFIGIRSRGNRFAFEPVAWLFISRENLSPTVKWALLANKKRFFMLFYCETFITLAPFSLWNQFRSCYQSLAHINRSLDLLLSATHTKQFIILQENEKKKKRVVETVNMTFDLGVFLRVVVKIV